MQQEDLTWGKNKSFRKEREKSQNGRCRFIARKVFFSSQVSKLVTAVV